MLGFFFGTIFAPRLVARFGTKVVASGSLILVTIILVRLSFLGIDTEYSLITIQLVILRLGLSNLYVSSTDAMMGAVSPSSAGLGSAINNLTRQAGGAMGVAILGSVLTSIYAQELAKAVSGLPAELATSAQDNVGSAAIVAAGLGGAPGDALREAANIAFMLAVAVASLAGAILLLKFMSARDVF